MENRIIRYLATKDQQLVNILEKVDLPPLTSTKSVFHDLTSCIIEQQIHYRSTKNQFAKLLAATDINILTTSNFEVFEARALTQIKLSARKCESLAHMLDFFSQHSPDWAALTDAEVRKILGQIKGVGKWTIDMILLFTLQRPNIFPADDYHLKLIMADVYDIGPATKLKSEMQAIAQAWAPYQSYGVRYLLAYKAALKAGKI